MIIKLLRWIYECSVTPPIIRRKKITQTYQSFATSLIRKTFVLYKTSKHIYKKTWEKKKTYKNDNSEKKWKKHTVSGNFVFGNRERSSRDHWSKIFSKAGIFRMTLYVWFLYIEKVLYDDYNDAHEKAHTYTHTNSGMGFFFQLL